MNRRSATGGLVVGILCMSFVGCGSDPEQLKFEKDIGHKSSALSGLDTVAALRGMGSERSRSHANLATALENGAACEGMPVCVSVQHKAYAKGDPFRISWNNTLEEGGRVVVALMGSSASESVVSRSVGAGSGTFVVDTLPVGEYVVRFVDASSNILAVSDPFRIFLRFSATRDHIYTPRDFIAVAWRDCNNADGDWVAIAPDGSSDKTVTMRLSTEGRDGAYAFGPLPPGTYRARYFSKEAGGKTHESDPVTVADLFAPRFQSISVGGSASCGVTPHHRVRCWGATSGLLPNVEVAGPAVVVPEISDAVQVAANGQRACALIKDGTVRCWGVFYSDIRGSGGPEASWAPIKHPFTVEGVEDAVSVSTSGSEMCAILRNGTVRCGVRTAAEIEGISQAVSLGQGYNHTCVASRDGTVRCWGENRYGQVGDTNSSGTHRTPFEVAEISDAIQVATGSSHTCILRPGGTVQCWGSNWTGQLGDGTYTQSATPVTVVGLDDAVALSLGESHSCALTRQNSVRCWGSNRDAQLGDGTTTNSLVPVEAARIRHVVAIRADGDSTCALRWDGEVLCWGSSGSAVTDGRSYYSAEIDGFGGVRSLSAGSDHTCALTSHGRVLCWGTYDLNEVPSGGSYTYRLDMPTEIPEIADALSISAGGEHSCAVLRGGAVRCWGAVGFGQSRNEYPPVPAAIPIPGLPGAVNKVSAGWSTTCALLRDGRISCWGDNSQGQRGDGTDGEGTTEQPTLVSGIGNAVDLSIRRDHGCAVLSDGTVRCWGSNQLGQLGNGSAESQSPIPVPVVGVTHAVAVGTSGQGTCVLLDDGTVSCWGNGISTPQPVPGIANATALTTGGTHACARLANGKALCWGSNEYGQLGTGTNIEQPVPVQPGGVKDALLVTAGAFFTCALHSQSHIRCWGYGGYGQFGDGTLLFVRRPTSVLGLR